MPRPRATLVLAAVLLAALIVVAVISRNSASSTGDGSEDAGASIGTLRLSANDVEELVRDRMGVDSLADIEVERPAANVPTGSLLDRGRFVGGVRLFELEARPTRWEYRDGQSVAAWAYGAQVPGPTLWAREGEQVQVEVRNRLPVATTVHWHGVDVPWTQDGVPGVNQAVIEPGDTRIYRFAAVPAGTRWYHTHGSGPDDEASQLDMGLAGALVIEPRPTRASRLQGVNTEAPDVDRVLVLDEWLVGQDSLNGGMLEGHGAHTGTPNVFTINGRAAPDVGDVEIREGDRVRLRYVNASSVSYHPMHLHGHQVRVVARDGNPVAEPELRTVVLLAPGETADVEFAADNPGVWMLHCHDLHHSGSGMHQLIVYEGFEPVDGEGSGHDHATHEHGEDEDDGASNPNDGSSQDDGHAS